MTNLDAWRAWIGSGVVRIGLVVVGLIAFVATARLGELVSVAWSSFPGDLGARGVLVLAVLLAVGAGALTATRHLSLRWMPWGPLGLLVLVRAALIPVVPTPMPADDDPRFLHELALGVLDGGNPLVAHRPMGFSTTLAAVYGLFGTHLWLAEVLNLAFAAMAGWSLHALVLGGWGRRAAATAVTLYAIAPSQVLLATTIYTETAYAGLLLAAMAIAARALRGGRLGPAVAAGALLALSQYVRPLSQAFLAVFVLAPFVSALPLRRAAATAAAIAVTFLVMLLPIAVHNATVNGAVSLSTSSYGGWSVFVGANQEHDGRFNDDDQRILASLDGSVWERSEELGRAGIERITKDPHGYADLVVRKFHVMWADDTFAVTSALGASAIPAYAQAAVALASQAVYATLTLAAVIALWRLRARPPPEAVLLVGTILVVAAAHTFVEVQPRYHAYVVPLVCALAAAVSGLRSPAGGVSPR